MNHNSKLNTAFRGMRGLHSCHDDTRSCARAGYLRVAPPLLHTPPQREAATHFPWTLPPQMHYMKTETEFLKGKINLFFSKTPFSVPCRYETVNVINIFRCNFILKAEWLSIYNYVRNFLCYATSWKCEHNIGKV